MFTRRAFLTNAAAFAAMQRALPSAAAREPERAILKLQRRTIEVNGKPASILSIRQPDGRPGLVTEVGKRFSLRVENELAEPSLVHWHGLTPPWRQDGVPGLSAPLIPAGGAADYDFPLDFSGTYWMHSHQGFQEQALMAAPLIIRDPTKHADRQEVVVMLADFSFRPPQEIYDALTKQKNAPDHMAMGHATHGGMNQGNMDKGNMDHMQMAHMDMDKMGMNNTGMGDMSPPSFHAAPGHKMQHGAAMQMADLNDVEYDAFLANDRTLDDPEIVRVENGGRVLLRLINSACMSAFHVDLGALPGTLVAVDGQDIIPVAGARFPIAAGQRLDIALDLPKGAKAYPVLFVLEGEKHQTGVILAAASAEIARVPPLAAAAAPALDLELESRLTAAKPLDMRGANRTIPIDLTGDMASYVWSINNRVWDETTRPISVVSGDRVELVMTNRTMMAHPMHLHGHRFQVVAIDGRRFSGAMRDTVLVPPGKSVTIAFDADNPGHWAFHCHLLYHASAGMFATVKYV